MSTSDDSGSTYRNAVIGVVAIVAVQAVFVAVWWFGRTEPTNAKPRPGIVEIERSEELSEPAPGLAFRTPSGESGRLADYRGRPVVVHFWGTWCPPCVDELPRLLDAFETADVVLLAVAIDDDAASLRRFFDGEPPTGVVLPLDDVYRDFGVERLPVSILVDADGRLQRRWTGSRQWSEADRADFLRSN